MTAQITQLPTPPSRSDTANFAARGDALLGALPKFVDEANALANEVNLDREAVAQNAANAAASEDAAADSAQAAQQSRVAAGQDASAAHVSQQLAAGNAASAAQDKDAAAASAAAAAASAAEAAQLEPGALWAAVNLRAPIASPTFTGIAVAPDIAISKAPGANRRVLYRSDGVDRWGLESNGAAESGSNAGSNLVARRYSDAGSPIDTPFLIDRATGRLAVGPGSTAVDANAALLVNGGVRGGSWFLPGAFTFSTLPTPSGWLSGAITHCSDAAGGASDVQCTGTEWLSLKTGLPANLQPTGGSGSKFWRRNADGTMEAWGSEFIDMTGSSWSALGPYGGRHSLGGTVLYGSPPFVGEPPRGTASWIDGDVSTWASYMSYYSIGSTGVGGGMELISPFSRGVRGAGSGLVSYNVKGRWKL